MALDIFPLFTRRTRATPEQWKDDNGVPRSKIFNPGTTRINNAGEFMPTDRWKTIGAFDKNSRNIGTADPTEPDSDAYLPFREMRHWNLF